MTRAFAALAAVVAVLAAGCGAGDRAGAADGAGAADRVAGAEPVGMERAGSVAQFADCGDWRGATRAERFATIRVLRGQFTPQLSRTAASPLPDEDAFAVFERACAPAYAESLRLYKLYVKVQGFAPLR